MLMNTQRHAMPKGVLPQGKGLLTAVQHNAAAIPNT